MALHHAASGEILDIQPLGSALRDAISTTLVLSEGLEVFRLVLPQGARVPDHKTPRNFQLRGQSTLHCLEGAVDLLVNDRRVLLQAGRLIYVARGETCALQAVEDSTVLVTMLRHEGQPQSSPASAPSG